MGCHLAQLQQLTGRKPERLSEPANIEERDVSLAAFNTTQVASCNTALQRERFLGPALHLSELSQALPEQHFWIVHLSRAQKEKMLGI